MLVGQAIVLGPELATALPCNVSCAAAGAVLHEPSSLSVDCIGLAAAAPVDCVAAETAGLDDPWRSAEAVENKPRQIRTAAEIETRASLIVDIHNSPTDGWSLRWSEEIHSSLASIPIQDSIAVKDYCPLPGSDLAFNYSP